MLENVSPFKHGFWGIYLKFPLLVKALVNNGINLPFTQPGFHAGFLVAINTCHFVPSHAAKIPRKIHHKQRQGVYIQTMYLEMSKYLCCTYMNIKMSKYRCRNYIIIPVGEGVLLITQYPKVLYLTLSMLSKKCGPVSRHAMLVDIHYPTSDASRRTSLLDYKTRLRQPHIDVTASLLIPQFIFPPLVLGHHTFTVIQPPKKN